MDWETKVLKRVQRHVELLTGNVPPDGRAETRFGWEATSLLTLRRRIDSR